MKCYEFKNYDEYIQAQLKITRRKVKVEVEGDGILFLSDKSVNAIYDHHKTEVKNAICHGVRKGRELEMFEGKFSGKWIGTEIVPEICDGERILHRDFNKIYDEWIGYFDIIYTNSYDHAKDPWKTIKVWLACLSKTGRLYIEWTIWHNKLGNYGNRADCFAASVHEYREIFEKAGKVEDILIVPDISKKRGFKFNRHIFVVH